MELWISPRNDPHGLIDLLFDISTMNLIPVLVAEQVKERRQPAAPPPEKINGLREEISKELREVKFLEGNFHRQISLTIEFPSSTFTRRGYGYFPQVHLLGEVGVEGLT
ncbi:hypothetical protein ACFE04_027072 [Oxalis oulophora]